MVNITVGEASKEFGEFTAGGSQLERVVHVPCVVSTRFACVSAAAGVPGGTFIFSAQIEKLLPSFLRKIAEK